TATAAPGGFGKTSLCMVEAVAMATGRKLLGEQPLERLKVWYHNGDDDINEIDRRVAAICQHFDISQEELRGWFFRTSSVEFPLKVARGYGDMKIDNVIRAQMQAEIAEYQIDICTLDPFVKLHSTNEQDNGRMAEVVEVFASIASAEGCGVELVHHT